MTLDVEIGLKPVSILDLQKLTPGGGGVIIVVTKREAVRFVQLKETYWKIREDPMIEFEGGEVTSGKNEVSKRDRWKY